MGELFKDCYECGKTCVNSQFTLSGDAPGSEISLPRTMKIKIIANPAYWGFAGSNDDNVMVSGYAYFSNGYYDFFYEFDPDWESCRTCGRYADEVCSANDNRPDISYRSVVDIDGSVDNYYSNGLDPNAVDGVTRGGAEVFLINRESTKTSDSISCSSNDPENQFKKHPDNFGFGNKILFKDQIYKNVTGAWRMSECYDCYANTGIIDNKLVVCNSGNHNSKQNIRVDNHFGEFYDPAKRYCTDHATLDCIQDGAIPENYGGELVSLTRSSGTNWYLQAEVSYTGGYASSLRNGQYVGIQTSGDLYNQGAYAFDITHTGSTTTFFLLGTYSESPVSFVGGSGDIWSVHQTTDPYSCCGGAAYGIDNITKSEASELPYHVDIRKVFNNDKNKLYSNREKFITGQPRTDRRRIETATGVPILVGGEPTNVGELPYYGPYYDIDDADTYLRYSRENQTTYKNGTCYTKSQELMIFPDSLVQSYEYESCTEGIQHRQNIVPRLTFVYKPCNYNDSCTFNASGHPMTAGANGMPSTLEDLKAGFGGQEIVMHINLGMAWGRKVLDRPECGCYEGAPVGVIPVDPEVLIQSPVTFPCLPKFDLRPNSYGCDDPMWYNTVRQALGISYQGQCTETPYDACWIRQPYPTYGYIRNLCGHKDNSRVAVLQSLAARQPDGTYTDISGSGEIVEPMYVEFTTPADLTGSGYAGATDGVSNPTNPYWGLTDNEGRLAFPYFRTKISSAVQPCCNQPCGGVEYVNFDSSGTLINGFPTSGVPFLIEIDHDDYCVGCSTNQIEEKQFNITIESLPASFLHGTLTSDEDGLDDAVGMPGDITYGNNRGHGFKYGFNYCKYPGTFAIPEWRIDELGNEAWFVPTGCGNAYVEQTGEYSESLPWTDETCGCLGDGITVSLRMHKLEGTNMPKYWSTDGGVNSYTPFPTGCSEPRDNGGADKIMEDYTVYFAAFMHCGYLSSVVPSESMELNNAPYREYGNLSALYSCGSCSHSYPATDTKPNLSLDFWYVRKGWEDLFEGFTDQHLTNEEIIYFLANGAAFGFFGPFADAYAGPYSISSFAEGSCGSGYKDVMGMCVPYSPSDLTACTLGATDWEAAATYGTTACTGYRDGSRLLKLGTTVPGCENSTITLYGYSYFNTQSHTLGTDGGFNRGFPHARSSPGVPSGCCEVGCFLGEDPGYDAEYYTTIPRFLYDDSYNDGCTSCSDYTLGCQGQCGALNTAMGCYGRTDATCCRNAPSTFGDEGSYINRPKWRNECYTMGHESDHVVGEFSWYPSGNGCDAGYYGTLNASHAEIFFRVGAEARGLDSSYITAWDGVNIPGLGTVNKLPTFEPIARRARGGQMSNLGVSTCNFDSGPNNTTMVASEFARVKRVYEQFGYDHVYTHMGPVECTKDLAGTTIGGTCVRPIYPNTMASIAAGGSGVTKVAVNKETCHPEIMTVHRIECSGDGYALHVSREYYEHDRLAYATQKYLTDESPPSFVINKYPIYGKIEGGREGIAYYTPAASDNPDHFFELCDTSPGSGILTDPNNASEGTWDWPIIIPMMSRSDYTNVCYPDESGITCVNADEAFNKTLCISYYDPTSYEGGSGAGASGYFSTDSSGVLSFTISNGGSGYVYQDEDGNFIPCAMSIYDNPCVDLYLSVDSGTYSDYAITGYQITYDACVSDWPSCCNAYSIGSQEYKDCTNLSDGETSDEALAVCSGYIYPVNSTWPVNIIGCDAVPNLLCDGITTQTCPNGDPKYPNFYNGGSGTSLWNYYNLVYDFEDYNAYFLSDAALIGASWFPGPEPGDTPKPFPTNDRSVSDSDIKTGFVNGSLLTNQPPMGLDSTDYTCSYSCIRDNANCGGEFFTNKEFLPRRSYATGTKVTRYGPLSICAQTAEHGWGNWLAGHVNLTSSIIDTKKLGNLNDVKYLPLVDPSRSGAYTVTTAPMGLSDDIIYVEDLTTLLGAKHPFFKMLEPQGLDSKSCIMPDSGCFHFLPIHNTSTAMGMEEERFFSGDDVYYTDREIIREAIASGLVGESGCLLNPFRIMVDVEPCSERLSHPGTSDPMNLSWVVPNVTAGVCRGWLRSVTPSCASTCDNKIEAVGLNTFFGCSMVIQYTCTSIDDSFESSCTWDTPPVDCTGCYGVDARQRFIFTGLDGVVYLSPVIGTLKHLNNDLSVVQGEWINASCKEGYGSFPGGLVSGYGHDCSKAGDFTYTDTCSDVETTFEHFELRKHFDDKYSYDDIFCTFMQNSTNYEEYKAGGIGGCGGGQIKGYRNMNVVATGDPSAYCGLLRQIHEEYECHTLDSIQECPYPSVLKVTITE